MPVKWKNHKRRSAQHPLTMPILSASLHVCHTFRLRSKLELRLTDADFWCCLWSMPKDRGRTRCSSSRRRTRNRARSFTWSAGCGKPSSTPTRWTGCATTAACLTLGLNWKSRSVMFVYCSLSCAAVQLIGWVTGSASSPCDLAHLSPKGDFRGSRHSREWSLGKNNLVRATVPGAHTGLLFPRVCWRTVTAFVWGCKC